MKYLIDTKNNDIIKLKYKKNKIKQKERYDYLKNLMNKKII